MLKPIFLHLYLFLFSIMVSVKNIVHEVDDLFQKIKKILRICIGIENLLHQRWQKDY